MASLIVYKNRFYKSRISRCCILNSLCVQI